MLKQNTKSKSGFTIIEVVLVLAIAGLIFLMVFVALPALQRSQRDTQRRNDYAALSTSVTSYMTNNNGKLPVDDTDSTNKKCKTKFTNTQINQEGTDPNGESYDLYCGKYVSSGGGWEGMDAMANNTQPKVWVISGATCEDGEPAETSGNRNFVVYGQLESGTYCNASS